MARPQRIGYEDTLYHINQTEDPTLWPGDTLRQGPDYLGLYCTQLG